MSGTPLRDRLRRAEDAGAADAVLVCVPTPLTPTASRIWARCSRRVKRSPACCARGQLVVLESTSYPGTTREQLAPQLEAPFSSPASVFPLAYSPERVDPVRTHCKHRATRQDRGRLLRRVRGPGRGALPRRSATRSCASSRPRPRSSPSRWRTSSVRPHRARQRAVDLRASHGIDVWAAARCCVDQAVRVHALRAGPGMGGHCLPVDPFYPAWPCPRVRLPRGIRRTRRAILLQFLRTSARERALQALNHAARLFTARACRARRGLQDWRGDVRVSPSLKLMALLRAQGAELVLPRPARPRAAGGGPAQRGTPAGGRRRRPRRHRDGSLRGRPRPDRPGGRPRPRSAWGDARRRLSHRGAAVSDGPVRLGVVGLGYWGPNLARNFAALPGCELRWLADERPEARERASAIRPDARLAEGLDELLADPDLDAVVLATPVPTHAGLALRVLDAGKHCFVEKPLAQSAADAERAVEAAEAAGKVLMVGTCSNTTRACASSRRSPTPGPWVKFATCTRTASISASCARTRTRSGVWAPMTCPSRCISRGRSRRRSRRAVSPTCAPGWRTWCSATCAFPPAWPPTCTFRGSTPTRSGGSPWWAPSRWRRSTTWRWTGR